MPVNTISYNSLTKSDLLGIVNELSLIFLKNIFRWLLSQPYQWFSLKIHVFLFGFCMRTKKSQNSSQLQHILI